MSSLASLGSRVLDTTFSRRGFIAIAGALSAAAVGSFHNDASAPVPLVSGGIGTMAQRKGLLFGAALDAPWIGDPEMMASLDRDMTVIGVANGFNWTRTQRLRDAPLDWTEAEAVFKWAQTHGKWTRGHNIIWHDPVLPLWLRARLEDSSAAMVEKIMVDHVRNTFAHWRGRLIQQDVVNEPITADGIRDTVWNRKLGEHYIDAAFHVAADTDPTTLRILNQDWIEMDSKEHDGRRTTLLGLLERLLKRGVPVQALGVEGHLQGEFAFSEKKWRDFLDDVTGMGLKVMITEYDVHDRGLWGGAEQRDDGAASLLRAFLDVTLSYQQCLGLVSQTWSDRYSWLIDTPEKHRLDGQTLRPNPLDRHYKPKLMYQAIAEALQAAPQRPLVIRSA